MMPLRILVLTVVLLILGAIGYFVGVGQAMACGVTAIVIYVYAMARRFNGAQAARPRKDDGAGAASTATMAVGSSGHASGGDCGAAGGDGGGANGCS